MEMSKIADRDPHRRETDMNRSAKLIIAAAIAILGTSATSAFADNTWDRHHPRRDQVNDRLAMQDWRIRHQLREGEITPWQAWRLHRADRAIRHEERVMASFHHGHITGAEQRALNQQENVISRRIGW